MLLHLNELVLDYIGKQLNAKDLLRLSMANKALRGFFDNECYWQKLMFKRWWVDRKFFRYQDDYLFILNNLPDRLQETTNFDRKNVRFVSYSHDGAVMAVFANGCTLWVYREDQDMLNCELHEERGWDKILSVEFSPDDSHLLVTGSRDQFRALTRDHEVLVFKIGEDSASLRSFIDIDRNMLATWFDNSHFLYMQSGGERDRMRIFMSSVNFSDEIIVYPILSFDTKIVKILVAQHVSPRTRRITQIADQAQEEGKTLTQKLIDIGLESGVDVTNMSELRAILDQETQCMPCYRLHSHHDAIPTSRCTCECHHNTDKLLIFHGSDERVHVKVITETLLEKAREANRRRGDPEGSPDRNRLYFPLNHCTVFDTVDHVFRTGASLVDSSMCLTPDNKYLYVTGTTKRSVDGEIVFEVKPICLDLDTMVLKNQPDFTNIPWVDCDYEVRVTANNDFVAIFSGHDVAIWSSYHRGHIAAALHFDGPVSCVALHPYQNSMCVTNEKLVHFYHSPVMAQEEE